MKIKTTLMKSYVERGVRIDVYAPIAPRKEEITFPWKAGTVANMGRKSVTLIADGYKI